MSDTNYSRMRYSDDTLQRSEVRGGFPRRVLYVLIIVCFVPSLAEPLQHLTSDLHLCFIHIQHSPLRRGNTDYVRIQTYCGIDVYATCHIHPSESIITKKVFIFQL